MRYRLIAGAAALACVGIGASDASADAGHVTEYYVPSPGSYPLGIAPGPDGRLWFTEFLASKVGRVTTGGVFTAADEFPTPTANAFPGDITPGPDGNLWFTEGNIGKVGRITPAGVTNEFAQVAGGAASSGITAGADGRIWFVQPGKSSIGRMNTQGVQTASDAFPVAPASVPTDITTGSDLNLWYVLRDVHRIGRMTTTGTAVEFPLPTPLARPNAIAAGADGNLWFLEFDANAVGRITPAGVVTEFPIPIAGAHGISIAPGPDGNMWFTLRDANAVGRITPAGVISTFPLPTTAAEPHGITWGPDGNVWFTELRANRISKITTDLDPPRFANSAPVAIPGTPTGIEGSPYPSQIVVAGLKGTVTSVRVRLMGLTHSRPTDVDLLLVGPRGQRALILSDVGFIDPSATALPITISDAAVVPLPADGPLLPGIFRPTNVDTTSDAFAAPAPAGPYPTTLAGFVGTDPNGTWRLYARDDLAAVYSGRLINGWGLDIETTGTPTPAGGGGGGTGGGGGAEQGFGARTLVSLSLAAKRIRRSGPVRVRVRNANDFAISVRLRLRTTARIAVHRGTRIVRARVTLPVKALRIGPGESAVVTVGLPASARARLASTRRLALEARLLATGPAGQTRTVTAALTPRLARPPAPAGR